MSTSSDNDSNTSLSDKAKQIAQETRQRYDIGFTRYKQSDHAQKLKEIFGDTQKWTVNNIVIVGLGYPLKLDQLYVIMMLLEFFGQHNSMNLYALEDLELIIRAGECSEEQIYGEQSFLQGLNITTLNVDDENEARPAKDYINNETLLFTPYLMGEVVGKLLEDETPELYIGTSLDEWLKSPTRVIGDTLKTYLRNINEEYVWARMPVFGERECCDVGGLSRMCIYRRVEEGEVDEPWREGEALDEPENPPEGWQTDCVEHR